MKKISLIIFISFFIFTHCASYFPITSNQNRIYFEHKNSSENLELNQNGKVTKIDKANYYDLDPTENRLNDSKLISYQCGKSEEIPIKSKLNPVALSNFGWLLYSPLPAGIDYYRGNFHYRNGLYKIGKENCVNNFPSYTYEEAPRNGNLEKYISVILGITAFYAFIIGGYSECYGSNIHFKSCRRTNQNYFFSSFPLAGLSFYFALQSEPQDKIESRWMNERTRQIQGNTNLEIKSSYSF